MKKFLSKPSNYILPLIFIGAVLSIIGHNYWGWFPVKKSTTTPGTPNARVKSDCCKDADGNACSTCVSLACCGAGFRAGYIENRDIFTRNKIK